MTGPSHATPPPGDPDPPDDAPAGLMFDTFDRDTMTLGWGRVRLDPVMTCSRLGAEPQITHLNLAGVSIRLAAPHTVTVDPAVSWDEAGRRFWNAVCRVAGQPEPFPDPGQEEGGPTG